MNEMGVLLVDPRNTDGRSLREKPNAPVMRLVQYRGSVAFKGKSPSTEPGSQGRVPNPSSQVCVSRKRSRLYTQFTNPSSPSTSAHVPTGILPRVTPGGTGKRLQSRRTRWESFMIVANRISPSSPPHFRFQTPDRLSTYRRRPPHPTEQSIFLLQTSNQITEKKQK